MTFIELQEFPPHDYVLLKTSYIIAKGSSLRQACGTNQLMAIDITCAGAAAHDATTLPGIVLSDQVKCHRIGLNKLTQYLYEISFNIS